MKRLNLDLVEWLLQRHPTKFSLSSEGSNKVSEILNGDNSWEIRLRVSWGQGMGNLCCLKKKIFLQDNPLRKKNVIPVNHPMSHPKIYRDDGSFSNKLTVSNEPDGSLKTRK